jgi:hypothetical protein
MRVTRDIAVLHKSVKTEHGENHIVHTNDVFLNTLSVHGNTFESAYITFENEARNILQFKHGIDYAEISISWPNHNYQQVATIHMLIAYDDQADAKPVEHHQV